MPSLLTPIYLLLGLLAIPIILLYMLRLRRKEIYVSSTLLWQKLLRDREANAPWQKLRRNLLLFLQLFILAMLVLALARPFLPVSSVVSGNVVVLLDGSASMLAEDIEPNRFEAARELLHQIVRDLGGGDQMTLIQVGPKPIVLAAATQDRQRLRQAVNAAEIVPGEVDWNAAFALAAGAAQGFQDARIVIVSDGGIPAGLPPLPGELVFVPLGESGENLAIGAMATRATKAGPELFIRVQNNGRLPKETVLSIRVDGVLFDSRRLSIPAASSANTSWLLPEGAAVIAAELTDMQNDALSLDNKAWAVHEGGVSNRTLLVTKRNIFLEQVYAVLPGVDAFKATDYAQAVTDNPFDLYVFDSVALPDVLPQADMLIINPQNSTPFFTVGKTITTTNSADRRLLPIQLEDSALLQFVDWSKIHIREMKQVQSLQGNALVQAEGGPLLITGEQNGHRFVIIPFDLHHSDLPLQISFPILIANLTNWLSPGRAFEAEGDIRLGDPVQLVPGAGSEQVYVTRPDGTVWDHEVGEEALFFTETDQLGIYQIELEDSSGRRPAGQFAVNLFAPQESAILPQANIDLGYTTVSSTAENDVGQREFWPWLAAIAFVVLIVEWWVHHRGARLPDRETMQVEWAAMQEWARGEK